MKYLLAGLVSGCCASISIAEEVGAPNPVNDCVQNSVVVKLAIAEHFDMGENSEHRFPSQAAFEQLSALDSAGAYCTFVYVEEGVFDIDMDERRLGFGSSIQPRITATPREPYEENLMIDFRCSRGKTAEADLAYLPEACRGEN